MISRERRTGGPIYTRAMPTQAPPQGVLRTFPPVFWLANVMELFERAAYYGLNSVLAVYLTDKVPTDCSEKPSPPVATLSVR